MKNRRKTAALSALALALLALAAFALPKLAIHLRTFDTVQDLVEQANPRLPFGARVLGYHVPGDDGGGLFYPVAGATGTNLGTRIASGHSADAAYHWDRVIEGSLTVKMFGASGDGLTDDGAAITDAINTVAALGGGDLLFTAGATNRVTAPIKIASNVRLRGRAATILGDGDFRALLFDRVTNASVHNITLRFARGGNNQAGLRFNQSTNCQAENITISEPMLNGMEIDGSEHITTRRISVYNPDDFGIFVYNSRHCLDEDCLVYRSKVYSYQFKNSQWCTSRRLTIIEPQTTHGAWIWTGYDSSTPGARQAIACGFEDLYVQGGPNTGHLAYIHSSPQCFIRGARLILHPSQTWNGINVTTVPGFFNDRKEMTGNTVANSATVLNVTNADQLAVDDQIRIGADTTVYTITAVDLGASQVTISPPAAGTVTGAPIGWISCADDVQIEDISITASGGPAHAMAVAGVPAAPIQGLQISNLRIGQMGGGLGLLATHTEGHCRNLRVEGNFSEAIYLRHSRMVIDAPYIRGLTNISSYGIRLESNSVARISHVDIANVGITGITSTNSLLQVNGGTITNAATLAIAVDNNATMRGLYIANNRSGAGSFGGQIRIHGTNNVVDDCQFEVAGSAWLDSHIKEQPGATGNRYGPGNRFLGPVGTANIYRATTSPPPHPQRRSPSRDHP